MASNETTVPISPGTGEAIDVTNVGTGATGSGFEVLRQVVTVGDPGEQSRMLNIGVDGAAHVSDADTVMLLTQINERLEQIYLLLVGISS